MKLKLSKRTRLILAALLLLAVLVWSLWGPDAAPAQDGDTLPAVTDAAQPLPDEADSRTEVGTPTDESNITGTPPDAQAQPEPDAAPAEDAAAKDGEPQAQPDQAPAALAEDGSYTSREDVALYLHLYGRLPENFMTKAEARELGWEGGSLERYAPGMCIGGDRFGNYEGLLPDAEGRTWTECDIDTLEADSRGAKRIVFSNDGLIYYTDDHYESFELLYGEEDA